MQNCIHADPLLGVKKHARLDACDDKVSLKNWAFFRTLDYFEQV